MLFLRKNKQTKQDKQSLVQTKWNDSEKVNDTIFMEEICVLLFDSKASFNECVII